MNIVITYIGGGSTDWAHKYFSDILSQQQLNGELRLYDINYESAMKNKKYFDRLMSDNKDIIKCQFECKVVRNIDEALKGANFVLISILPYSLNNMKVDVHYPEKYGIYQSVGDTVGPGGYSRALRTIPAYIYFAEKIKENCKDAWIINYTNPMAMCVNTLYKVFPEIKAFGCCHEVFGTQKLLSKIVNMYMMLSPEGKIAFMKTDLKAVKAELSSKGKKFTKLRDFKGLDRHEIITNVQGINHFTWVNDAKYKDEDILPIYAAYIKLFRLNNINRLRWYVPSAIKLKRNIESIKFELFEKYGVAAAAGDRHLAEFLPQFYLKKRNEKAKGLFLTPVWGRIMFNHFKKLKLNRSINRSKPLVIKRSGEEGINQIAALCGLSDIITNVNIINRGQSVDLPLGTAVESNAILKKDSISPVNVGKIKSEVLDLIKVHSENQKNFIDAYIRKDREGLVKVFLNDPSVAKLKREDGIKLFNEMVELNKNCLEDFVIAK